MGLAVFPHLDETITNRRKIVDTYNQLLRNSNLQLFKLREDVQWNFSYYPIIFNSEAILQKAIEKLALEKIFPRRYFYSSLNKLNYIISNPMYVSESISSRVLCLPLFHDLSQNDLLRICSMIDSNA